MIHCESAERRCNSSGGINKHYSKAASMLSTNVNVTHGRESPNESPISWVPNLPPLCQIRGPSDEREDKWLPRCNGTQIICCESTVVMVSGVCVCVWAHDVCKLARVRKCKNARLYPEAPRCVLVKKICVRLPSRDSLDILLPKVVLRASHGRALRWFAAGLLDIVLSCSTQKKRTATPLPGHCEVAFERFCPFFSEGGHTFELVSAWVIGWPLPGHDLQRAGRSIKIRSEKSGKRRNTTASLLFFHHARWGELN